MSNTEKMPRSAAVKKAKEDVVAMLIAEDAANQDKVEFVQMTVPPMDHPDIAPGHHPHKLFYTACLKRFY